MKRIQIDLNRFQKPAEQTKATEWQELGKELTEHFKKNCYWLPWKYELWKIRAAFKVVKDSNKSFNYFLGILKRP